MVREKNLDNFLCPSPSQNRRQDTRLGLIKGYFINYLHILQQGQPPCTDVGQGQGSPQTTSLSSVGSTFTPGVSHPSDLPLAGRTNRCCPGVFPQAIKSVGEDPSQDSPRESPHSQPLAAKQAKCDRPLNSNRKDSIRYSLDPLSLFLHLPAIAKAKLLLRTLCSLGHLALRVVFAAGPLEIIC